MVVRLGIEVLRDSGFELLAERRVGLLTNPSGVDRNLQSTFDILWEAPEVNLTALFSPEHGFAAEAADGAEVASTTDSRTGLPIHSLYGDTRQPTSEMLEGVDVVVCDIQDIGVRYYTYTWTISHVLEGAGKYGTEVVILDRPNPLGGTAIVGPSVEDGFSSSVGRFPVPICHGMTVGEMSRMVNTTWNPTPATLTIVQCDGWRRLMTWVDTGLPWVPPSPGMPHLSTLKHYPGACLVEGTQLSEGRGTPLPFEVVGAPWIDGYELAAHLNAQEWPRVRFRAHTFRPTTSKWNGEVCQGVQVHIVEEALWQPLPVWLGIIREIRLLYSDVFDWLPPHSPNVESGAVMHFDRLIGSDRVRHQIDAGLPIQEIVAGWVEFCRGFDQRRKPFLFYD
jgi:uncharacterized protein YbbC (DUF1343 family)